MWSSTFRTVYNQPRLDSYSRSKVIIVADENLLGDVHGGLSDTARCLGEATEDLIGDVFKEVPEGYSRGEELSIYRQGGRASSYST